MCTQNKTVSLEETTEFRPQFNDAGLVPCIAVDAETGAVLMMAWMNDEAIRATLDSGIVHYWSRSRQELWKKGATSGALQHVDEILTDCDQDTILVRVRVNKPEDTCHTGRRSCFYRTVHPDPDADPKTVAPRLKFVD